jgi:exodeoxyribonuclease V
MSWSPQQDNAIREVRDWLADKKGAQIFRLFGYAGTGKTTLAKELAASVKGKVLFATFTGKASLVLRSKGCKDASTIHSLIYKVEADEDTGEATFTLNEDSDLADAALLIVDEVSMVGAELAKDLMSFGVRILVLGDPAQLPPVKDEGFFINAEPDIMLTEVHRQAADNPIIAMSMAIREGRRLQPGRYGTSLIASRDAIGRDECSQLVLQADQVLCGLNRSRVSYNKRIRLLKGLVGNAEPWHPTAGDRLICLKNAKDKGLFNGSIWNCDEAGVCEGRSGLPHILAKLTSLDEERSPISSRILPGFFDGSEHSYDWRARREFEEFTFGWAITCHKSQGSQWNNVVVFDESGAFRDDARKWLYTAITRAAEQVTVIL